MVDDKSTNAGPDIEQALKDGAINSSEDGKEVCDLCPTLHFTSLSALFHPTFGGPYRLSSYFYGIFGGNSLIFFLIP
mgnify:CR=1 FL=1